MTRTGLPEKATVEKHDFVRVEPEGLNRDYAGVVTEVCRYPSGEVEYYSVQPWDEGGPQALELDFRPKEVALHSAGRMSVIDDISELRFNHR